MARFHYWTGARFGISGEGGGPPTYGHEDLMPTTALAGDVLERTIVDVKLAYQQIQPFPVPFNAEFYIALYQFVHPPAANELHTVQDQGADWLVKHAIAVHLDYSLTGIATPVVQWSGFLHLNSEARRTIEVDFAPVEICSGFNGTAANDTVTDLIMTMTQRQLYSRAL
jgi:hypothetical protein